MRAARGRIDHPPFVFGKYSTRRIKYSTRRTRLSVWLLKSIILQQYILVVFALYGKSRKLSRREYQTYKVYDTYFYTENTSRGFFVSQDILISFFYFDLFR